MRTRNHALKFVTVMALAGVAFGAGENRKDMRFKVGKHPVISINNPYGQVVVKSGAPREVVVSSPVLRDQPQVCAAGMETGASRSPVAL